MIPGSTASLLLDAAAASVPAVNWALASNGGTASAAGTDYGSPSSVNNGDRAAAGYAWWRSGTAHPQWLQITLSAPRAIRELNAFAIQDNFGSPSEPTLSMTTANGFGAFVFQYLDGSTWVNFPGGSFAYTTFVWKQLILASPVTTTAVRMYWASATNFSYQDVAEFEVWT